MESWNREEHFPIVKFSYNCVIHRTIGISSFEVVYAFNPLDLTPLSQVVFKAYMEAKGQKPWRNSLRKFGFTLKEESRNGKEGEQRSKKGCA